MSSGLDFTMSPPIQITLGACALFPVTLFFLTQFSSLNSRNATQFLFSFLLTTLIWLSALVWLQTTAASEALALWTALFLYSGSLLVYLEIWGLLSRGYTLGLLLTLYKAKTPLSAKEIASAYRGGEGLNWLIQHRFAGLIRAKIIEAEGEQLTLTQRGCWLAFLYKLSLRFFGLRQSG